MAKDKRSYFETAFPIGADMEGNAERLLNGTVCTPQKNDQLPSPMTASRLPLPVKPTSAPQMYQYHR